VTRFLVLLLPFLGAIPPLFVDRGPRARRSAAWLGALPTFAALALLVREAPAVFAGEVPRASWEWLPALGLSLSLRIDGWAWTFAALVLGIGLLILLYARYYLSDDDDAGRFFSTLMLFMGSMLGVVLAGNLIALVVFWELTSLSSFLLIGFWSQRAESRRGALLALAVTGLGGLALLAGVILIGRIVGSYELDAVLAAGEAIAAHPHYRPILLLVLLGAFTKSAQFPFHFWLPRAMAAPTPVSAYLHSATMVKAGVFLLGRLHPALSESGDWFVVVGLVGLTTLLVGAAAALFAHDLKGLLAYSTISHLGLITLLFGYNSDLATVAAVFHVLNHATFKASLFMAAGIIDHEAGTRDLRVLNGLFKHMPYTATLAVVAAAAMAGVPLLNGFLSKEMFFSEALLVANGEAWRWIHPLGALLGGVLSVAYSVRFVSVFFRGDGTGMPRTPHEPPRFMRVPVELLVVVCVAVGVAPALLVGPTLAVAVRGVLDAPPPEYHLALWHGFNLPLAMSALALAGGCALFAVRHALERLRVRWPEGGVAEALFDRAFLASLRGASALTSRLENGSLQSYLTLFVVAALAAGALPAFTVGWGRGPERLTPFDYATLAGWLFLVLCAVATAVLQRRRFAALIAISGVGLMVALAFVRFSAPDLALTQLLVEVVTILLVLLALRYLPLLPPPDSSRRRRARDLALALASGGGAAALAWAVLTRPFDSISGYFLERSLSEGGGRNVVNIILVDFRGFDTLGEITVLGVAALGVLVLLQGVTVPGVARRAPAADRFPVIPAQITRALMPLALLSAVFLFLRGHNLPGGGFIAGLLAAVALVVQHLASGAEWTRVRLGIDFRPWIAFGVGLAALTGVGAWLFGRPFLTSAFGHFHLPLAGEIELATAALFDLGVFLTVVASVMLVLERLGTLSPPDTTGESHSREASPWKP
jgi:multicomponent K+:H+ antiporter subunit A